MIFSLMFAFIDLFIIIIFMAVYGRKKKYSEGMLLGVHIPAYAMQDPEVEAFLEDHNKRSKWFYAANMIISTAICFLNLSYFSAFITLWCLWLLFFCCGAFFLLFRDHRRMYDLKVKRGWQGASGSKIVVVDTNVSASGAKLPFSVLWHLPVLAAGTALTFVPGISRLMKYSASWIFILIFGSMFLLFFCMHLVTNRVRNKVYSNDSKINLQVNQLEKRVFSMVWLSGDYANLTAYAVFVYFTVKQEWMGSWALICYISIHTAVGLAVLAGMYYLSFKKKEILDTDDKPLFLDDDIYWKNGWYSNPNDKRLWVQDRFCSANYTTNMARPAGKILTIGTVAVVGVMLVWMCAMFLKIDLTPRYLKVEGEKVTVSAPFYSIDFNVDEIKDIELVDRLPEGSFTRTNGMSDNKQMLGKFEGKEAGELRMYIFRDYSPILKIELPDYTVYINSQKEGEAEQWYRELLLLSVQSDAPRGAESPHW